MKKLIVLDIVGLSKKALDKTKPSNILRIFDQGFQGTIIPSFPAVTCSVQASITSGTYPSEHGIIANGYYDRNAKQVNFWEQFTHLVEKPRIWDILKHHNPDIKTAVLFWQNSLFTNSDVIVTPKPIHLENRMIMWCYSKPVNFYENLTDSLGDFDLSSYWGPFASLKSSKWIINATKLTIQNQNPNLLLVYLPHLDYAGQKFGPESTQFSQSINELDELLGDFISFLDLHYKDEYEIIIISEYGFNSVNNSISPNQILKNKGLLHTRSILGKEYLDFEHSNAFAMVDHQITHIFTKPEYENTVQEIFNGVSGISKILDSELQNNINIKNTRSGNLILCARDDYWFNYYWWENLELAPDFAFNVDIHRKPGYDPLELFVDLNTKKISHDTTLIKGSHGVFNVDQTENLPTFGTTLKTSSSEKMIDVTQIAPTIASFFNIKYDFVAKSII